MLNRISYNGVKDNFKYQTIGRWNDYFDGFVFDSVNITCYNTIICNISLENQYSFKRMLFF